MPREHDLLLTPYDEWATHPKNLLACEFYRESDPSNVVRWGVYVANVPAGEPNRFRFIFFTTQYDALVGIGHEQMSGRTVHEACSPDDAVKIAYQYEAAVQEFGEFESKKDDGIPFAYSEFLEIGGERRWWRTRLKPVRGDDGRIWKLIGWSTQIVSIEAELRTAIAHQKLAVHYQPICDLGSINEPKPRIVGYEALIRWPHSGHDPGDFLPIAKAAGLMEKITDFVIAEATKKLTEINEKLWVSVNVSNCSFEGALKTEIATHNVDPSRLRIEVTEDTDLSSDVLARLHDVQLIGHLVSLDDFGDGASNFAWVKKTGAIAIKLDRQFVTKAYKEANKAAICRGVINWANDNIPAIVVIVEGIETFDDWLFMATLGANEGQGWLFGRPEP